MRAEHNTKLALRNGDAVECEPGYCLRDVPQGDLLVRPPYRFSVRAYKFAHGRIQRYHWAPSNEVAAYTQAIGRWQRAAEHGEIFGCESRKCLVIMRADNDRNTEVSDSRLRLAVCSLDELSRQQAVPQDCLPLVSENRDGIWVYVLDEDRRFSHMLGKIDFDISVIARDPPSLELLREACKRALQSYPLLLEPEQESERSVLSARREKYSSAIPTWFELTTVRVEIADMGAIGPLFGRTLRIDATPLLNKQNEPDHYTPATRPQLDSYLEIVRHALQAQLGALCRNGTWKTSELTCP